MKFSGIMYFGVLKTNQLPVFRLKNIFFGIFHFFLLFIIQISRLRSDESEIFKISKCLDGCAKKKFLKIDFFLPHMEYEGSIV
jgi:hypothetical protein